MKTTTTVAVLTALFVTVPALGAWSQQRDIQQQTAQSEASSGLTAQEEQAFDIRLRAAKTELERAQVLNERDNLIQARFAQQSDLQQQIPRSPREETPDPIMSDVPTPRGDRTWTNSTLPGGALAPTGTGTGPSNTTGGWGYGP